MARSRQNGLQRKFHGEFDQLDAVVLATGSSGRWEWMPRGYWRFKRTDGAILNWWATGTFDFQGPPAARDAFERALVAVVYGAPNGRPALPSPRGEG